VQHNVGFIERVSKGLGLRALLVQPRPHSRDQIMKGIVSQPNFHNMEQGAISGITKVLRSN
jgi:hypothetical protein